MSLLRLLRTTTSTRCNLLKEQFYLAIFRKVLPPLRSVLHRFRSPRLNSRHSPCSNWKT